MSESLTPPDPAAAAAQVPYAAPYTSPPTGRPASVTALGIIGIIISAFLLLCTPLGLVFLFIDLGVPNPALDVMRNDPLIRAYSIVSSVFMLLLMVGLLFASIGALSLKPWARSGMVLISWLVIVHVLIAQGLNLVWVQPKMDAAMQAAGMPTNPFLSGPVGAVVGLLFYMPYPICVIYFFNRPRVKDAFAAAEAGAV